MSRLGLTKSSQNTGESLWQALDPEDQVVKVGLEVDVGYPLQSAAYAQQQAVTLGDSTEGTTLRPIGLVEAISVEVSSTKRIPSQTIELSSMVHRRPIRVLLDSGSIGNYMSDHVAQSLNLIVQSEEGTEH